MKVRLTILFFCLMLIGVSAFAQSAEKLYNQSLDELNKQNYKKAIKLMDEFITKYSDFENIHMIYLNRAGAKSLIKDYDGALKDYTTAYEKNPAYAEALRQRGYLKKGMGNFKDALTDYDLALTIDPKLAAAYVNKAVLLDTIGKHEEACKNYEKALELGITDVAGILHNSCDSNSLALRKYYYEILTDKTTDVTYGYSKENPIKVGHGPEGQRAYLKLLRDGQGNKVEFMRAGSGGMYPSKNGMIGGMAVVDIYELNYKDEMGKKKQTTLYISFYDYEQPFIPVGFYSIEDFISKNKK